MLLRQLQQKMNRKKQKFILTPDNMSEVFFIIFILIYFSIGSLQFKVLFFNYNL